MSEVAKEREKVIELVRANPLEALNVARSISDPWYKAQALAWVARYAVGKTSEKAISESRLAASRAQDTFQKTAVLAWPIRAAIESSQERLACEMVADAVVLLPKVDPPASRAEAANLLLNATYAANKELWVPLLVAISECCPANSHWRAKRLHQSVREFLATVSEHDVEELAETFQVDHAHSDAPNTFTPRVFFW